MKKLFDFLTLFGSFGTLICCALPATLVLIGSGAAVASAVSAFPELVWLSQNKLWIFLVAGFFLAINPVLSWALAKRAGRLALDCPLEPGLNEACQTAKSWTRWVYPVSVAIYLVGAASTLMGYLV